VEEGAPVGPLWRGVLALPSRTKWAGPATARRTAEPDRTVLCIRTFAVLGGRPTGSIDSPEVGAERETACSVAFG
jgi:hypothetical protein